MTLNEFLKKLEQTPRKWKLDQYGGIRLPRGRFNQCPIEALDGDWIEPDGCLGLARGVRSSIIHAADDGQYRTKLRARLLKACGLS